MKKIIIFFPFLLFIIGLNAQIINEAYDYPVKPGTEEWKKLKSGNEMADACNISGSVLQNLSTRALVSTCLNYPLFNEVLSANNLQAGFSALLNNFNGFNELINRRDAAKELLLAYQKLNVRDLSPDWSLEEKGSFTFKYTYIELLLSQTQILSKLNNQEKQLLRQEAVKKFEQKKDLINDFGVFGLNNSAWTLGKLLQLEEKQNLLLNKVSKEDLNTFLSTGTFSNDQIINNIYTVSKSL